MRTFGDDILDHIGRREMSDPNLPEGVTEYDIDERSFAAFPGEATEEEDEIPEEDKPFDMQAYAQELIMGEVRDDK